MRIAAFIVLPLATVMLAVAQPPASVQSGQPEIIVDRATPDIFPESWLTAKISAKAELLTTEEQQRCREILGKALGKYPSAVVSANLQKVYGLGGLKYSGVATAGTRSKSAVYVVGKAKYTAAQVEGLFHAEFSSILLRNSLKNLDEAAWRKINPPDFHYRGSGVQAIKNQQASLRSSEALHEEGFLNEYSKASVEEDFNSYAARLFMGDAALWKALEKYPKLMAKADLTISFYGKLDAGFTKEFFQILRQPETK